MFQGKFIGALLLMGGEGRRFGGGLPKQFHRLAGKEVYLHTLEAFLEAKWVDEIVLACHPDWVEEVRGRVGGFGNVRVVAGGSCRQASSWAGLQGFLKKPEIVLIHDAVRPFVSQKMIEDNVLGAIQWGAVNTCIPSSDTLVFAPGQKKIESIPLREQMLRGQTPQTFRYDLIVRAHEEAKKKGKGEASDDCRLAIEMGCEVGIVAGDEHNLKITTELDFFLAEQLLRLKRNGTAKGRGSLAGKKVAVLGGTGGIGSAVCGLLAEEGAEAVPLSRKTGTDLRSVESVVQIFESLGPIDALVNCAGILTVKPLAVSSWPEIEESLRVNFLGLVAACKEAKVRSGGHIINFSSSSFTRGRKDYGIYSAAKAAVVNFTQALAEERPDLRIHVIAPQRTDTPLRTREFPGEARDSLLDPKEVAQTVINLLKDPDSTGWIVDVKK